MLFSDNNKVISHHADSTNDDAPAGQIVIVDSDAVVSNKTVMSLCHCYTVFILVKTMPLYSSG